MIEIDWSNRRAVTRRVGRPRRGTILLWSFHDLPLWERLQQEKAMYVDSYLVDEEFKESYEWMREQMALRLSGYEGHYPWWAYYAPRPDLRTWSRVLGPRGARWLRLELAIEPDRVLLSNYEAWCAGVGSGYISLGEADRQAWEAELRENGLQAAPERKLPEPWRSRVVKSWERIFDLEMVSRQERYGDTVQGTFERLELSDVAAVTEFTSWGR